ncbi:MAG TPA: ATP-binding protein [Anaeromyxobacteraceae bacterium]|nr:ATP-binding protein [Anaeromyxobacteraceae bacterium]
MEAKVVAMEGVLRRLALALAIALAASGAAAVAAGLLELPFFAREPELSPFGRNSGILLLASGLALALRVLPGTGRIGARAAEVFSLFVVVLTGLSLAEHGLDRDLGIERLVLSHAPTGSIHPASGLATGSLFLLGLAILLLDWVAWRGESPSQALALLAALVPLQAIIGYCYGVEPAHGAAAFVPVGIAGSAALTVMCACVLLARPEHGMVRVVVSPGPAGFMARRLLVAIVLLPIVLGWLFLVWGLRAGQYEEMVGASLVVLSAVVLGAAVVWWNARALQRVDEVRTSVEETLRAEREWFRTTLASIGDAVIAADDRGRVSEMNAMAEALTGFRSADALRQPVEAVFRVHGANRRAIESPFARIFREMRAVNLPRETVLVARSGEAFPVEGCGAPIRDGRGQPRGVVLVFRDIRERRRVEEERSSLLVRERAARADAEQASRAKDEFIATLSHELRTPLNSVLGWARLLRLGKLDATSTRRAVEAIERGATTQAQIVDDLLDMARIVRGQLRLDVRPVELVPVIEAAIDTVRPAAAARGIAIAAGLDPKAGPVAGDPGRLQQVAWNLFTNAIKFTPSGGKVEVRLAHKGDHVELSVKDTGSGIPAEFLPHVFERFRQADSSTTRAHGGLGLGLSIVRHIVEAHGGTVSADSPGLGQGSVFTVSLPIFQNRPRPRDAESPRAAPRAATPAPHMVSLQDVSVLVVDDDADTLEVVRQLLEQAGARVTVAGSAPEALEAFRREPPQVLLSDIGMPGQDGYDLIRQVRSLEGKGGQVPAVALTAFAHSEHRQQAFSAGYQLYLAKPIEPGELTAAVARLLGRANRN